jgi:nucleotidyltransferase/DNA polymerase involved in DNA repair
VKPNGLTIIDPVNVSDFLAKVPIQKVWGIGPKTGAKLAGRGMSTALDLARKDIAWVRQNLAKPYEVIWNELNGTSLVSIDVATKQHYSSIQKTRTFHPITNDKTFLWAQLSKHIEDACAKARHYNLVPKKFSISLKTKDLAYVTRSVVLPIPSNSPEIINALAHAQFDSMHTRGVLYRTAGAGLQDLFQNYTAQKDLFGGTIMADKFDAIHKQIDALEDKFGKRVVYLASTQQALQHKTLGTDADGVGHDLLFL